MAVKSGWTGRVYEDFTVGDVYHHPLGRTVLPVDNSWFTLLTQNMNPIHFDHAYAAQTEFGSRSWIRRSRSRSSPASPRSTSRST
jgi:acyl dehydratase